MFSAGTLDEPGSEDNERFVDFTEAERAAKAGSIDDHVWAVWDDDDGEIMVIAYQRILYYLEGS